MRYVLEAIKHNVSQSQHVTVVERVFVNAGSRQYSTVECDTMPALFEILAGPAGIGLNKLMPSLTK